MPADLDREPRPRERAQHRHACGDGEIVAYLDDDAHPDPHWLRYLVATMEDGGFAGAGGPNLPPHDDGPVARCVAEAPGGPDPRPALRPRGRAPARDATWRSGARRSNALGGFDPQFRVAGDDVDICWRLLEAGHRLGFSPAAVVWHSRRPSVRAYLRQQRGYGAAEALLERKWPQRYGPDGHARWRGRLYGRGLVSGIGRARVYYGTWGSEPFQALYGRGRESRSRRSGRFRSGTSRCSRLAARVARRAVVGAAAGGAARCWPRRWSRGLAPGALGAARATFMHERLPRRRKLKMWMLTTFLHLAQPLARLRGRMRTPPWRPVKPPRAAVPRRRTADVWSEEWRAAEDRLADVERAVRADGAPVFCGSTWDRWDLHLRARPAGRSPAADGARGARRRAAARAHADHAARAGRGGRDRHGAGRA